MAQLVIISGILDEIDSCRLRQHPARETQAEPQDERPKKEAADSQTLIIYALANCSYTAR
jgi:hypothetical protein